MAARWLAGIFGAPATVVSIIIYARLIVLLLPSYFEGMSRVLMEAAATARPIITSDVAGCRELVEAGYNGWLCPPADARALARAMVQFLQTSS